MHVVTAIKDTAIMPRTVFLAYSLKHIIHRAGQKLANALTFACNYKIHIRRIKTMTRSEPISHECHDMYVYIQQIRHGVVQPWNTLHANNLYYRPLLTSCIYYMVIPGSLMARYSSTGRPLRSR